MKISLRCLIHFVFRGLLASVLVLAGCASHKPVARVVLPQTSINGRPAQMMLDTGSSSTLLFARPAKQLGLKYDDLTESTPVTIGGQTFSAPLPIFRFPWFFRAFVPSKAIAVDGLVGWPEIRDNILVFDADRRTVRGVEQLPPETAGWLKVKVVPNPWLLLEIPLSDGKTGTMEVDTGSPFGVELPPKQWKEWKEAHPQTHTDSSLGGVLSFGPDIFHSARADQIQLGQLTLTDIAVQNMPGSQGDFIHSQAPAAKAVWAIGIDALRRMDLIVDGKSGFAYMHPKPRSQPAAVKADALLTNVTWSVADGVRYSSDNLFMLAGDNEWNKGEFAAALADYTEALKLNPSNAAAYFNRGAARDIRGDFAGALSDFDKVIELSPDDYAYARLYRLALLRRLGRPKGDFSETLAAWKGSWRRSIGLFLTGALDEKDLLEAAKKSDAEPAADQKCEAYYFIGMMRLCQGDQPGARASFEKCRSTGHKDYDEYQFAGAELKRLN